MHNVLTFTPHRKMSKQRNSALSWFLVKPTTCCQDDVLDRMVPVVEQQAFTTLHNERVIWTRHVYKWYSTVLSATPFHETAVQTWPLTCEEEEYKNHDHGVAKVKNGTSSSLDLKFGKEIMYSIDEEIHCSKSTGEEWSPPPVIVL